ncbi:MAG: aminotransferase class V-fold PLP-dependent enzyme [Dinoroseobacter sp.]|nr:aminotransferase class V-fold PLP-dependent enzyme [Dinoroseobacter sp.]
MSDTRDLFHLPEGIVYLDGNSLGPLPKAASSRIARTVEAEWGERLINGWNEAGWMDQPARLGNRIGRLIGAAPGTVVVGETLTTRIFQCLAAALQLRPDRRVVLSDTGNFPSDLYAAQGLLDTLGRGYQLKTVASDAVEDALGPDVAVLMLTEVDYRTGARHDMAHLTRAAQDAGAVVIWDLAHSTGAVPVDLTTCNAEFAAGCTYKYLNAGPGAPAFLYARADISELVQPALAGWLGHAAPFDFTPEFIPAGGAMRFRVGTPPVLQMAALDAALDAFEGQDLELLHARACALADRLAEGFLSACPELVRLTPSEPNARGSQISFSHPKGYAMVQALIAQGVIGDFRAPDILRFGITPLYVTEADVDAAITAFGRVIAGQLWDDPAYATHKPVT